MSHNAIYPGTFDPITYGHINILEKAARQFDHTILAVADYTGKPTTFNLEERYQLCLEAVSYTHLRAHETPEHLVCRLLLEKKKKQQYKQY